MCDESEAEESGQYRSDHSSPESNSSNKTRFLVAMSQAIVSDNTSDHKSMNNFLMEGGGGEGGGGTEMYRIHNGDASDTSSDDSERLSFTLHHG